MSVLGGIISQNRTLWKSEEIDKFGGELQRFPGDDFSQHIDSAAALFGRPQWVTPESVSERLPYRDPRSGLVILADAIIDNREDLFGQLGIAPEQKKNMTDSELILLAFEKWGEKAAYYLIGDFAFVIWDERARLLYGARDLMGSRTLYYHWDRELFAFCSVISPLFSFSHIPKALCEERFAEFLAIPILLDAVNIGTTYYKDVYQIPPAHAFMLKEGKLNLWQYGSVDQDNKIVFGSDEEYVEAFRDIYTQSIRARLRTFRGVSVTLSGGLDSGSVAAFASGMLAERGQNLMAFSSIPDRDFVDWTPSNMFADESPFVQATVNYAGNIEPNYLDLPGVSPYTEIDETLDYLETPYKNFENSFWIRNIHKEAARQGAGILLTGARGNFSVSWGSAVAYYALLLKKLRWMQLYREIAMYGKQLRTDRARIIRAIRAEAFPERQNKPYEPPVSPLINPEFAKQSGVYEKLMDYDVGLKPSDSHALRERQDYYGNLAMFNLQGTMAAKSSYRLNLWERDPTSDVRVIRYCLSIPLDQYVNNGLGRALIRRATENVLPDKVRLNQRTRGIQGADWGHRIKGQWPDITAELRAMCDDERASRYLNIKLVRKSLERAGGSITPEQINDPHLKVLMRSLIAYRFMTRI